VGVVRHSGKRPTLYGNCDVIEGMFAAEKTRPRGAASLHLGRSRCDAKTERWTMDEKTVDRRATDC
jgi:hypothetical protein